MGLTHGDSTKDADWPASLQRQLSPAAARYLRGNGDQAQRVIAQALEKAAANQTPEDARPRSNPHPSLPGTLQALVIKSPPDPNLMNLVQAAQQLHITRPTLDAWVDEGKVIAWESWLPAWVIPPEQILGPERIVPGIQRVLEVIPEHRLAWEFLTDEVANIDADRLIRPIDALKAGEIEAVVKAAHGWGVDYT